MLPSPIAIPAFSDNYIWAISHQGQCVVVDPGDAAPVERFLNENGLNLAAILVTHHHPDHVAGIATLTRDRNIPVYGPARESIPCMTDPLGEGQQITLDAIDLSLTVMEVPGHTLGHIAYYSEAHGWLFCGDTLFAGGCGRLFEGTPSQMYTSLHRLAELPAQTLVYCTHEYTRANLEFALAVTPEDQRVEARLAAVVAAREEGQITLPTTIAEECRTNPFLRSGDESVKAACEARDPGASTDDVQCFASLRRWKDNF